MRFMAFMGKARQNREKAALPRIDRFGKTASAVPAHTHAHFHLPSGLEGNAIAARRKAGAKAKPQGKQSKRVQTGGFSPHASP